DNTIDITRLFLGSEGSLGCIVEIEMFAIPKPKLDVLMIAYFSDPVSMGKATWEALQAAPSAVEVLDHTLIDIAKKADPSLISRLPSNLKYLLMIEFDGDDLDVLHEQTKNVKQRITRDSQLSFHTEVATEFDDKERLWEIRKTGLPLLGKINDHGRKSIPVIEDAAVPPQHLSEYLEELYQIMDRYDVPLAIYGHAGKGLLHTRPFLNLQDSKDIVKMEGLSKDSFNKVKQLNGTVSGEHGDGRVRGQYIKEQYGEEIYNLFLQVKKTFDPKDIMNPGIKVTTRSVHLTDNLRYGQLYQRTESFDQGLLIHFESMEWENEIEMCHGCTKCTTILPTVNMCPVYKGKRTETASPKAKANVIRSIISGKISKESALKSSVMSELIFNCTNCQSCVVECPSNVNIPKIALQVKAEYVDKRGQPINEYLLGSFGLLGKLFRPISFVSNWIMRRKISRWLGEKTTGITRHRELPSFNRVPFESWYRKKYNRKPKQKTDPLHKIVFFSGCSANYVSPNIGKSLIKVLEENNIHFEYPKQKCCGLPMYAYGNVERAKKYAQYSVDQFLPYVREGYSILVTCSSCGLSLKKEWFDLFGTKEAKEIAEATFHFSEYLLKLQEAGSLNKNFGKVDLSVGYHTPCHLKVQFDAKTASPELLEQIPALRLNKIDEGCCGICGSWGYKKENYSTSIKIGSGLLSKFNTPKNEIGVTDCPTCTMQMEHGSEKQILHPVEIMAQSYENAITSND
ncbi:MAG: anaerobic glycerol-3-phosphate dehydrogenase subunit C, partial [Candidatus Kariarchaeaceae archaeon]